ncbi:hypothetical protein HYY73_03755 [Candidatus Woesearchaeota archaeon]|nr:hypothetical protein [Candidatus Woesearchaeota archaeon]
MIKKTLAIAIAAIITVALAALFWPKDAGGTCGFCPSSPAVQRIEHGCLGFKHDIEPSNCLDCGIKVQCYGIVTDDKTCYTYLNGFNNTPTEVPCTSGVKGVR